MASSAALIAPSQAMVPPRGPPYRPSVTTHAAPALTEPPALLRDREGSDHGFFGRRLGEGAHAPLSPLLKAYRSPELLEDRPMEPGALTALTPEALGRLQVRNVHLWEKVLAARDAVRDGTRVQLTADLYGVRHLDNASKAVIIDAGFRKVYKPKWRDANIRHTLTTGEFICT
ncbi:unnamed protein product [Vitrella brassicaformis CCMP3155]|uniref:Uncharacterized protein n=1 Tax=Vitrella brassicaformis (strain CCMP3155) TaxID=1169540 RepID=A0A0G4FAN1_VITBC|nr:unnamed protein product [Vitrella brassicaformis CCMP3155]|eukprot:CEM09632.1 unnamed protein product [Vitrella brassicaformis CCMP3155]